MNDDDERLRNKIKHSKKIVVHIPSLVILSPEDSTSQHTNTEKIPTLLYPKSNKSLRTHYLPPLRMRQESVPNIDTSNLYSHRNLDSTFREISGNLNGSFRNNFTTQLFDQFKESKLKRSWLEMTANSVCKKNVNSSPKKLPSSNTQLVKLVTPRSLPKINRFSFPRNSNTSIYPHLNIAD